MSTTRYPVSFWYGSRAQYAAITSKSSNTLYFISDDNTLYRGTEPFARDLHNWLCAATAAPSAASVGEQYFNSSTNLIHTCTASGTPATWDDGSAPQSGIVYYDTTNRAFYAWNGSAMLNLCNVAADSAVSGHNSAADAHSVLFNAAVKHVSSLPADISSCIGGPLFLYTGESSGTCLKGHVYQAHEDNGTYEWLDVSANPGDFGAIMSGSAFDTVIGSTHITANSSGVTVSGGGAVVTISSGAITASGANSEHLIMSGGAVTVNKGNASASISDDGNGDKITLGISGGCSIELGGSNPEAINLLTSANMTISAAGSVGINTSSGVSVGSGGLTVGGSAVATEAFVSSATSATAKSTDTMPTAGADYLDKVFVYTGTTTANYKHGHLYVCRLENSSYVWVDVQTGLHAVGNLVGIRCFVIGGNATVKWSDPDDLVVDGVTLAAWGKTVLVRKTTGYPESVSDGTVVVTNTTRNAYKSNGFTEAVPSGETYYYRWFIYTDDGVLNDDPANEAVTGVLTWASILDMCGDASIDMRDVFSPGDVLTAANSVRATDGNGNFQWQVTDVTEHDFGLCAYKSFAQIQFDAPQKAFALTPDTVFATSKLLNFSGYNTTNGDYFLKDETATGTDRVWRRRSGTMEVRYYNGAWIVFNTTNSSTAATQTTAATDPWDGAWSNSIVVAKAKKYYTYDGTNYTEATVTDGDAVTADTYYEANPGGANRISYGSNDYENSPYDQLLNSDGDAGTFLVLPTIWSNSPAWAASQAGFKKGFDPDFLAAVKDTTFTVNLNTVCAGGGQKTLTRKFYLLSQAEVGLGGSEGSVLELYNGAENADRIKYNLSGGAQHWFLRSPYVGSSYSVYTVYSSGALHYFNAHTANGCVPACRIGVNQA